MKKVLTVPRQAKLPSRKLWDAISAIAIILTVTILSLVTVMTYPYDSQSVNAGGFAIYKGETEKQEAALMFNVYEGADNVNKILSILRKYSAKATFFIGGIWAEKNRETLLDILRDGHEIGSHGYLHKDHAKMSIEQNREEILISVNLLKNLTGVTVNLFAPPSGSYGENTEKVCRALGLKMILWSKDTIDWRDTDPALLIKRATKNISKGDMILMHPKEQTVTALPSIIEAYLEKKFLLVSVSDLIAC